jgi:hypothetical protein
MATKLVSMKLDPKSQEEKGETAASPMGEAPVYPYGLSIQLDEDSLEALGLEKPLPKVDAEMMLYAKVTVTSVSSNESQAGSAKSVGLQITDMCLEDAPAGGRDHASALYGEEKGE